MSSQIATAEVMGKPLPRRLALKRSLKRIATVICIVVLAIGGWLGWKFYQDTSKLTGDGNPLSWLGGFVPSDLQTSNGRVNVLLAGYSADDAGHSGAQLTDSIMILSVNPTDKSSVIISVPRDLYVNIPGYGYSKINAAYEYGQSNGFSADGYPNGGMGLLEKALTDDFGIQFNYYALINYTAFKDAVNAVGGVTVDIQSPNAKGLYDPNAQLDLANGTVRLDGQQALNLARARGEGYGSYGFVAGDFDRTAHQRMLLLALKDKASSTSVISNPLKVGALADALGSNVRTDMSLGEIETFYTKVKDMSDANIKSVSLNDVDGQNLLSGYQTYDGQSALIPADGVDEFATIQSVIHQTLYPSSPTASSSNQ